jgi:D-alanyl-D-alanine carboxypeptidase
MFMSDAGARFHDHAGEGSHRAACVPGGVAWGHNGQVFGYYSAVFSTPDGSRQAAVGANAWIVKDDGTLDPTVEQVAAAALRE